MDKEVKRVLDSINILNAVGVYAITSKMINDHLKGETALSSSIINNSLEELAASDFIIWDATKAYFRPVKY